MDLFEKCYRFTEGKSAWGKEYEAVREAGLYPYFIPIQSSADTEVIIHGEKKVMIGSNNYLGLTHHPKVLEAAEMATRKYGSGCTGSRFLNGTLDIHIALEEALAEFVHKDAALVFSTGFQVNLGVIDALVQRRDIAFIDSLSHACVVDGCRLSWGEMVRFKHNDLADLSRKLENAPPQKGKLIIIEGIYSMEGDIGNIPGVVDVARKHGCRLMVDDAHGVGVLGPTGAGTVEHFGVEEDVDLIMGTFSKSFACIGGFIAAEAAAIDYLKHHANTLLFSASMPPSAVATVHAALEIIKAEPERRERLWKNARKMQDGLQSMGYDIRGSQTPVVPVVIGEDIHTFMFWKRLLDEGVFTNPIVSPAVPPGSARIRTSYMASHTDKQLDFVLDKFDKVGKELGII
ncbi:MAG: aminotransferase class I/II-fold pyridoxal phosphate-dependent enzyme [Candidatus Poribacteria bacterium]|nr:aminotransferase class I/II-fold pyridoxal phosphate-dependent enzyme [Candidatus Poribacteria bacterium]